MNYLFPVKSITIQRKGELVKIKLKYTKLNKLITFHTGTVDVEFKLYTKMKLGYNPNTNKLPEFQLS